MQGALVQSSTFPWAVSNKSKIHSKQSGNTKRQVKMMCTLQTPPLTKATTFSEDAKKVIKFAQEEARQPGHNFVGAEVILLGLIGDFNKVSNEEDVDISAKVFKSIGIFLKDARPEVEEIIGSGSGNVCDVIPFTPRAKHVLESSQEEAQQLGRNYIGSEHLLLGLLRVDGGVNHVLRKLGVSLNDIGTKVMEMVESPKAVNDLIFDNKMPIHEEYGIDLTKLAKEGKLDVLLRRQSQSEIKRVTEILGRLTKNNPCLVGEHDVRKTSIVESLAESISYYNNVPDCLKDKKVISVNMRQFGHGERQEKLKKLIEEIKESGEIILFIEEIHTGIGVEGPIGVANILKQALVRGELQCIGATTPDEYQKLIEKDPTFEKLFQPVKVPDPTFDETLSILFWHLGRYKNHHKVRYTYEALEAACNMSCDSISNRFHPGKAIDLIDEAGSFVGDDEEGLVGLTYLELLKELKWMKEVMLKTKEDMDAFGDKDFKKANKLWDKGIDHKIHMLEIEERIKEINNVVWEGVTITKADIEAIANMHFC
ncbi:unnamed protein product [Lactuca virosa]|uniref:Clp R domain-containing protein n=1 Tax=Lactuca virosa TaxID=75947 RepID=A0AAU9NP80_9ASTR|nr:unnamed protein product [Lactuca virosa]CAH1439678.1 unnamed protein product [Lactuca virosa]